MKNDNTTIASDINQHDYLSSLPEAVEAPPQPERRPRIDLKYMFAERFPNFAAGCFTAPIHNHKIHISLLTSAAQAARKLPGDRYQLAAELVEGEAEALQLRLDAHYSALADYAQLDPVAVQANWKTELPRVHQLLDAIDIRDPENMPFSMRAYMATNTLAEEFITGMPPTPREFRVHARRTFSEYEVHFDSSKTRARQQAGEAWLEVAKRWAAFEAVYLEEDGAAALKELFDHRWESYTQGNQAYLAEQARLKAEAERIEEEARLTEVERVEGPLRRAAEAKAAAADARRVRFDELLTKGPALLDALERLAASKGAAT